MSHATDIYYQRKSEHCCVKCGKQDSRTLAGKIYCIPCNEKKAAGQRLADTEEKRQRRIAEEKLTYAWYKQKHMCTRCGGKDERTLSGLTRCRECMIKDNRSKKIWRASGNEKTSPERKEQKKEQARERYQKRKERGICIKCGKRMADGGSVRCIYCNLEHREQWRRTSAKMHPGRQGNMLEKADWKELGLCMKCGCPLDGQLNRDGSASRLCKRCYAAHVKK